jgi:hypothetical protein
MRENRTGRKKLVCITGGIGLGLLVLGFVSSVHALTGDDCLDPFIVGSTPFNDTVITCDFNPDYDLDFSCTGHTTLGPDIVYQFTPPDSGCWHLTVAVPWGMWNLSLYILTACDPPVCIAGADEFESGSGEAILIELMEGVTYYIVVDGRYLEDCGEVNFGITECISSVDEEGAMGLGPSNLRIIPTLTTEIAEIHFGVTMEEAVDLRIYDLTGARVRTLVENQSLYGEQSIIWDSRDDFGQPVPKGTYFVSLQTGTNVTLKKLTVLR